MEHISIEDFHQVVLEKGEENVNIVDVRTPEKFAVDTSRERLIFL